MRTWRVLLALCCALLLLFPDQASAQRRRPRRGKGDAMKIATLAPEGTSWTRVLSDLDKDLQAGSGGKLSLRVYAGGVQGDEKLVLRKIALGQLHAGAFTGMGLGEIVPSVRLLELPFAYRSSEEVELVRKRLDARLHAAFEQKGFVLIGWVDVGFAQMYSTKKLQTIEELRAAKPWVWEGDPVASTAFSEVGVEPTPLALPDVLTSLSTGLVDTVYTSPMACVGLQWFSKVSYVADLPLAHGTGGLLVQKAYFQKLTADQQALLRKLGGKHGRRLTLITRDENEEAAKTLAEKGIQTVPFDPKQTDEMRAIGRRVAHKLALKHLYTEAELQEVLDALDEYRKAHKSGKADAKD